MKGVDPTMRWICSGLVSATISVLLALSPQALAQSLERDYAVFRGGSEIGTRTLRLVADENGLEVINETSIAVKVIFITAYRREETLREIWRDGRLVRFSGDINNDGEQFEVEAVRQTDGQLRVEGSAGIYMAPPGTLPATWWHDGIVRTDTLIHVMRGKLQHVTSDRVGTETINVAGRDVKTVHHRISGDENVDLWFDDDGIVVRAIYQTEDDNEIEFRATEIRDVPADLGLPRQ